MKILFQGDSVTDAGRDRSNPHDMGEGYPKYASAMIEDSFPDVKFEFINLGISGDRTENLVARLESDFIEIQPDIVSIMIGINDVWHYYAHGVECSDEKFENNYRQVLSALRERTHAKILMIAPFLIDVPDKQCFHPNLDGKIAIVDRLADEFADSYLKLDRLLAEDEREEDKTAYAADGVHPTSHGACVIGEYYLNAITPLIRSAEAEEND